MSKRKPSCPVQTEVLYLFLRQQRKLLRKKKKTNMKKKIEL